MFEPKIQPLSTDFIAHKSWVVTPEAITFSNWWVYSDDVINNYSEFTVYGVTESDSWSYPSSVKEKTRVEFPKNSYFSYTFHQAQTKTKTTSLRATTYDVFRSFGSLLSFTIRFTVLGISTMQSFSLSNSLIKKLYSVEARDEDEDGDDDQDRYNRKRSAA